MRSFIALATAGLLAACTTYGKPISSDEVSRIEEGRTTKQELVGRFGKPIVNTRNSDGSEILGWAYAHVGFAGSSYTNSSLTVTFAPDGTVQSYTTTNIAP